MTKFLEACGLADAAGVIITIHDHDLIDDIVAHVRAMRPDVLIVSRARDADHARHLYRLGATDAVPETVEASLQLSEAALVGLGVPGRAGDRLDPRKARRDSSCLAGRRPRRRTGENSFGRAVRKSDPEVLRRKTCEF